MEVLSKKENDIAGHKEDDIAEHSYQRRGMSVAKMDAVIGDKA